MSTATANPEVDIEEATEPKVRRKRLPLVMAGLLLLAAIGGGTYWFMGSRHAGAEPDSQAQAAPKKEVPPIYVPLESFTVNLQPEAGDQYLQVTLSLKLTDPVAAESIKTRMPEIRNRMLLLLSSKHASDLVSTAGKEKLGNQIQDAINLVLVPPAAEEEEEEHAPAPAEQSASGAIAAEAHLQAAPAAMEQTAPAPRPDGPVGGVLFTSFIIQ